MRLEGIHHISCITGDAVRNVEFYVGLLGLRMVKKSVNQDDPTVYHLFYADEIGSPGSDITFFEYPNVVRGHAGAGFIHRVRWRVGSYEALEFWEQRLRHAGVWQSSDAGSVLFTDHEGLGLELSVVETDDRPLMAQHPDVPDDFALQGFDGVRAYTSDLQASVELFESCLGFESVGANKWEVRGSDRGGLFSLDESSETGREGAGTVHHIAWASPIDDHPAWRQKVAEAGAKVTPIIDRYYFKSMYFREPSGVLFEIATIGPGFTIDEDIEHLGEGLALPQNFEHLRDDLKAVLTPLPNPRKDK